MSDFEKLIKAKGKCCISEMPMSTSKHINLVELRHKATWAYPVCGNVLTGQSQMAMAVIHDDCIENGLIKGTIKYAIEFSNDEFIYHLLPAPQVCRVCGCTQEDACIHPDLGSCWWMEPDLCSHCVLKPGESKRYSQLVEEKNV